VRRVLAVLAAAGCCAIAAAPAGATNECRGLMVCVPVVGPWVVATPGRVEFQLACPQRYIVAGLDAELTSRGIEIGFVGALGSPVNPGITTSREAVFLGRVVRDVIGATFRPHIGCIPATGGGRRTPTAAAPIVPPGAPTVRQVVTARVTGTKRIVASCRANERLVDWYATRAFATPAPPAAALVASLSVRARPVEDTVVAAVVARQGQGIVQVAAVCAGGR